MLETPHALLGAAIAVKVGNPALAIPLAFASHFILDMVPHWNPHLNKETKKYGHPTTKSTVITAVDSTTALISGSLIAWSFAPDWKKVVTVLACCFFAVLPDVLEAPYFFLNYKLTSIKKLIGWQVKIQANTNFLLGMTVQVATIAATLWWILK